MRFSVNCRCLFPELPFAQAAQIVARHGYRLVEDWGIDSARTEGIAVALEAAGVALSAFCPAYFVLNRVDCHDQYEAALRRALIQAKALGCRALITQVGNDTGEPRSRQHQAIVTGLRRMAPLLAEAGVTLLVEPLNTVKDHPGYYLTDSLEAADILAQVDSPWVRMLYDLYHQLHMGERVLDRIRQVSPWIGHFHMAGYPDRDARLFEGFDYRLVLEWIRDSGIQAPVGLELTPGSQQEAEALLDALIAYQLERR